MDLQRFAVFLMLLPLFFFSTAYADESPLTNEELGIDLPYKERVIRGWKVRFHGKITQDKALYRTLKSALQEQLKRTSTRIPRNAVQLLRRVPIYVFYEKKMNEENLLAFYDPNIRAVVFHDAAKLSDLQNYRNAVVLHELAHGYHHQVLGYSNPMIIEAYEHAKKDGLYAEVDTIYSSKKQEAYALTNHIEYFAELTETYFSKNTGKFRNDYYPFTRYELKDYDPVGYDMIRKTWRQ